MNNYFEKKATAFNFTNPNLTPALPNTYPPYFNTKTGVFIYILLSVTKSFLFPPIFVSVGICIWTHHLHLLTKSQYTPKYWHYSKSPYLIKMFPLPVLPGDGGISGNWYGQVFFVYGVLFFHLELEPLN